jgi:hypothetical protein
VFVVMIGAMLSWELLMPEALWFFAFAIPLYQALSVGLYADGCNHIESLCTASP